MTKPIIRQVLTFIQDRPDQEHTARSIMTGLKLPQEKYSAVRRALCDLSKASPPEIVRTHMGFYRSMYDQPDGLTGELQRELPLFHGITLIGTLPPQSSQKGGSPHSVSDDEIVSRASQHCELTCEDELKRPPSGRQLHLGWFQEHNSQTARFNHIWRDREVLITMTPSSVDVRSRFSDDPLAPGEMDSYISFLEGLFAPYFWTYHWEVRNLGINKDFKDIQLDGIQSLTLRDLTGVIRRWYHHKGRGARREIHSPVKVGVIELLNNLDGLTCVGHEATMEDNTRTRELLTELTKELKRSRAWSMRLADKVVELKRDVEALVVIP